MIWSTGIENLKTIFFNKSLQHNNIEKLNPIQNVFFFKKSNSIIDTAMHLNNWPCYIHFMMNSPLWNKSKLVHCEQQVKVVRDQYLTQKSNTIFKALFDINCNRCNKDYFSVFVDDLDPKSETSRRLIWISNWLPLHLLNGKYLRTSSVGQVGFL